jgi:DUF971 family protein
VSPPLSPRALKPRNLAIAGRELAIAWGDGHESYLPFDELRARCPCALCRAEEASAASAGPLRLVRAPVQGSVTITALRPVGAYALQIVWSDGHDSGIFPYERLRGSCPCAACKAQRSP